MVGVCPRPEKVVYFSKRAGKRALAARRGVKHRDLLHVYRCPCGRFHIGHQAIRRLGT